MVESFRSLIEEVRNLGKKVGQEYLSNTDAAAYYKFSRLFLNKAIIRGELPVADMAKGVGSRIWRIRRKDRDGWIAGYVVGIAPSKKLRMVIADKDFTLPSA